MRRYLAANGARGFVVGLSGGVDSAIGRAAGATGGARRGRRRAAALPQRSAATNTTPARREALLAGDGDRRSVGDLRSARRRMRRPRCDALPPGCGRRVVGRLAAGDPRAVCRSRTSSRGCRMTTLYFIANSLNYLVAGTGTAPSSPIGLLHEATATAAATCCRSVTCTGARSARWRASLHVPSPIIERTPSAGLWGRPDRRGRNGLQLLRPRALPRGRATGRLAGAGHAHRAPGALERPQAPAPADAGSGLTAAIRLNRGARGERRASFSLRISVISAVRPEPDCHTFVIQSSTCSTRVAGQSL